MRQTPYGCASFAFMFDEVYEFGAGETLTQRYRLVIANGGWDAGLAGAVAGELEAGCAFAREMCFGRNRHSLRFSHVALQCNGRVAQT